MKATHSGHCQACGSLQKLPGGTLSLHGYSVAYGFFNGVFRGARHEPFETSCALVETFIAEAQLSLRSMEAYIAKLRVPTTTARAWVSNYEGATYGRNSYVMRLVDVIEEVVTYRDGDGSYSIFTYVANGTNGKTNVTHKLNSYGFRETLFELCDKLNAAYASKIENCDANNLKNYINWQRARVAAWQPAALLPVSTKNDKQEFKLINDNVMTAEAN